MLDHAHLDLVVHVVILGRRVRVPHDLVKQHGLNLKVVELTDVAAGQYRLLQSPQYFTYVCYSSIYCRTGFDSNGLTAAKIATTNDRYGWNSL